MGRKVLEDLTGRQFDRLTVIERTENSKSGRTVWLCQCSCKKDNYVKVQACHLKSGHTQSCGCIHKENISKLFKTHGDTDTRLYRIYHAMITRCYNENQPSKKYYVDKDIIICNEWLDKENGYLNFKNWALQNGYQDNLSIDRKDVNDNYKPDNCRWATDEIQVINQGIKSNNKSGYKGVFLHKKTGNWESYITFNKKRIYLGVYKDIEDAIKIRQEAEQKYFGELVCKTL